ncbi:uncharacterized protein N7484_007685 [Penicillium longicatenatum]|uniref:uncharacterized protein n=1 Tax=Penicillium longicatenatum TaxID=1561947 RepID=UPI0025483E9B|nr:uncharacterized protein N7484_007685 [Penicillium longicatenatum]KAJ5639823.1 hypothetical protein N7484_007685 [Penicillium longicatenatum]
MPPRGRGGKFKPSRGGGKHFSRDLQPLDKDGNAVGLWREPADEVPSSSEEESSSEESSEESDAEGAGPSTSTPANSAELTREERRNQAKAKKQAALARRNKAAAQVGDLPPSDSDASEDEALPANPNHTAQSRKQLVKEEDDDAPKPKKVVKDVSQLSRREREALQAQQARERYLKLHAEGKTDEARSDLARLAIIREQREAERLRKEAEKEERDEQAKERNAAILAREEKLRAAAMGKPVKKGGKKK